MTTQIGSQEPVRPVVGLALGSGSARGWAHIGIIQALEEIGVQPQVVAGTSIGALVGGAYVTGTLNAFADWVESLTVKDVFGLLDISFSGGMVKGEKLFSFFQDHHENPEIETLDKKLVTVATEKWPRSLDNQRADAGCRAGILCLAGAVFSSEDAGALDARWWPGESGSCFCRSRHGRRCGDRGESQCPVGWRPPVPGHPQPGRGRRRHR